MLDIHIYILYIYILCNFFWKGGGRGLTGQKKKTKLVYKHKHLEDHIMYINIILLLIITEKSLLTGCGFLFLTFNFNIVYFQTKHFLSCVYIYIYSLDGSKPGSFC